MDNDPARKPPDRLSKASWTGACIATPAVSSRQFKVLDEAPPTGEFATAAGFCFTEKLFGLDARRFATDGMRRPTGATSQARVEAGQGGRRKIF